MATETPRVQVGIPWRAHPSRLLAFDRVLAFYAELGIEVVAGESPAHADGPFNIAATRNYLVRERLTADVMVLSDADTLPSGFALLEAIEQAQYDDRVHLPYHLYRRGDSEFVDGACSGVLVFNRTAWDWTNGQDERFAGWGYEDSAFRLAQLTLNGPLVPHQGVARAFEHDLAPRDRVQPNRALYRLYREAYGDPVAMRKLVDGVKGNRFDQIGTLPRYPASRYSRPHST